MSLQDIADCLKFGLPPDADPTSLNSFIALSNRAASDLGFDFFFDSGLTLYQAACAIRGGLIQRFFDISEMTKLAQSKGFILPDSPLDRLNQINATRRLYDNVTAADGAQLYKACVSLGKIYVDFVGGTITFDRNPAMQLASYEVSVDGLSAQSGDALVDILGYQPDGDFIKAKRAQDALAKLDFSKRKPYLLFTADFEDGTVVCWQKMPDASGYRILRRDVFASTDLPDLILGNSDLMKTTRELMADDRFFQIISFYDWLDHGNVVAFLDLNPDSDTLFSYAVKGIQKKAPGSPFIFEVPTSALFFSTTIGANVDAAISKESQTFGANVGNISPYPALAQALYGDSNYGWILAGCNIQAAIKRGDDPSTLQSFGFIGSTVDGIKSAGQAGKLVVPADLGSVQAIVESSIASYGVSQTISSILEGTGLTQFVAGKDDPKGISQTDQSIDAATSGLARILSAIDPATATLDPHLLAAATQSTATKLSGKAVFAKSILAVGIFNPGGQPSTPSGPTISLQTAIGDDVIDLTTYAGISRLMQVLRTIYDFYPGALS